MATQSTVQVVSKEDPSQATLVDISPAGLPPLAPSSVRVQSFVVGLTAANLAYATMGKIFHWWDVWPVPSIAPAPYNDASIYGIVPAWGFAVVLQSNVTKISPNTILWGMFPTSTVPVDLLLTPNKTACLWTEASPHRSQVMHLYQRYIQVNMSPQSDLKIMGLTAATGSIWECGYLMNQSMFPADPNQDPIHPLGTGLPWTKADADLSSAAVVNLGAGSKTAISFTDQLLNSRPRSGGPLGLLEVTASSPESQSASPFPHKTIPYHALTTSETLSWISSLNASRVVIFDYGGRDQAVEKIYGALLNEERALFTSSQVMIVSIGRELGLQTPAELQAGAAASARLGKVLLNTSPVRALAIEMVGEEKYFAEMMFAWKKFRDDPKGGGRTNVVWSEGMRGESGFEGGWKRLCQAKIEAGAGLAFKL